MKTSHFIICSLFVLLQTSAWAAEKDGYKFTTIVNQQATPVKDQASSGTCWCFATNSFVESELLRKGKGEFDLSEMFIVRQKYMNQLKDNFQRKGKGNITEGSITSSWVTAFNQVGIVPEEVYRGINYASESHNHSEMTTYLTAIANVAVEKGQTSPQYEQLMNSLFDIYLGKTPETFTYKGKEYTPKSFAKSLDIHTSDYVMLTSFTHKPMYELVEIEVPDNWEHDRMYNVSLDEMMDAMKHALKNGYTLCWDGDVSESGFGYRKGVAINPEVNKVPDKKDTDMARWGQLSKSQRLSEAYKFERPYPEVNVTSEIRQKGYETFQTTDDHLMHITGMAQDQNGTLYFITKNSWGANSNPYGGYLNMSESYVRAKTIYIMLHKDGLPKDLRKKLGID